jgi:hypothetical protein
MGFENGKLVRVVLKASNAAGNTEVNTLHYDLQDSSIPGESANDPQALADRFRDDVIPHFAGLFKSDWTIAPVEVQEERDPQAPYAPRAAWSSGTPVAGSKSVFSDLLPSAVTMVATLLTANVGRRFRGRMFIPGSWAEAEQDAGQFNSTAFVSADSYLNAIPLAPDIQSGISSSSAHWCVYSRTQRAANLDPYANAVVSFNRRSKVHWLRSREK